MNPKLIRTIFSSRLVVAQFVLALAAILFLWMPTAAEAGTFGRTTAGAVPSGGLSPDYKRGSKFTLTEPAVLNGMYAYLDGFGGPQSGRQRMTIVVYKDVNGVPGPKITESYLSAVQALAPAAWVRFFANATPLPAGTYWLVIHTEGPLAIARDYGDGAANWYSNADAFADGASSPFGAGNTGTVTLSIYATYTPVAQFGFAGRATIGSAPSGGLTSNFKRGSRFTLTQAGRLESLAAYLDGKGGGTGTQRLQLALYRDANGVPGARIAIANEIFVNSGNAAQWIDSPATPVTLDPGNYWIVIHSGDTGGIARDYGGDGAASWYGNADTYSDGPASPFGSGSTGTGTITAVAMYYPAPLTTRTFGRTFVPQLAGSVLPANRIRANVYSAYTLEPYGAVMTALWAYLDGGGSTAGSQTVRMALYEDDQYHGQPAVLPPPSR